MCNENNKELFKWVEQILNKIETKENLDFSELHQIEMGLKLLSCYDEILDESLGISDQNIFEMRKE